FGDIPAGEEFKRNYPQEEKQTQARELTVEREVPLDAIYKVYHMPDRLNKDYYAFDLLSDILSRGDAARFHRRLIKGKKLFTDVQAYIGGDFDPGLFSMSGFLNLSTSMEEANKALLEEIEEIKSE